ncbi:MAG: hypothetical protein MGF17_11060 [Trichodesmium sp. MAG_R04]|nr:hypothetical protein [Trichodesmium sp. MAG_R04]
MPLGRGGCQNKKKAVFPGQLSGNKINDKVQKKSTKRNLKIELYLNKASRYIINYLIDHNLGNLVIGNNPS